MTVRTSGKDRSGRANDLAEDLRRAIGRFVRAIRDKSETERSAQSETMDLLDREGGMNVAALADRRGVTHQTMRVVVAQMVADGLVDRSPDPADHRSHLISLSHLGRSALHRSRRARAAYIRAIVERSLSALEQRQLQQSIHLLDRISDSADD